MGARLVRGRRPVDAGVGLTPQPWWFGPQELAPPGDGAPFDLVLLDRDGTINVRIPDGYVTAPEELLLLPGAADGVARLTRAGCRTILVTNQRGVARGLLSREGLVAVHRQLDALLAPAGGRLDAVVVCPHEQGACRCRKPLDGLFREALSRAPWARAERCVMVGDMPSDLEPAAGLGMRTEQVSAARDLAEVARLLAPSVRGSVVQRGERHVP